MYEAAAIVTPQVGPYTLPELPFAEDALAPVISRETIALHHGKHHRAYVDKLNDLVAGSELAELPLDELVRRTAGDPKHAAIFNNAGQAWNHHFYWRSLSPSSGKPSGKLLKRLDADFGGAGAFMDQFVEQATGQFGSGWAWLVVKRGKLDIVTTSNADTPMAHKITPLLTLDVWEHAYYLDFKNEREAYARIVVERLLNWEFAEQNFERG